MATSAKRSRPSDEANMVVIDRKRKRLEKGDPDTHRNVRRGRRQFTEADSSPWKVCTADGKPVLWTPELTRDSDLWGKAMDEHKGFGDANHYAKRLNTIAKQNVRFYGGYPQQHVRAVRV